MYTAHPQGVQTAVKAGKKYRVLTTFPDATELVEEYDIATLNLECRRWRSPRPLGGSSNWEFEIGEPGAEISRSSSQALLRPSLVNPTFHPHDTKASWKWHIRNLPYPEETYRLDVDEEKGALVLRTTNKKYFKVFRVPAMVRAGLALHPPQASLSHDGRSTLTIAYVKPASVVDEERKTKNALKKQNI